MRVIRGTVELDRLANDAPDDSKNTLVFDGQTFVVRDLKIGTHRSKGGNSSVFALHDPNRSYEDRAIKISNVYRPTRDTPAYFRRRYGRFIEEIEVLKRCADEQCPNIVQIHWDGITSMGGQEYPYYVMEKANSDLKEFLLGKVDLDDQARAQLCYEVHLAIKQLHGMGYYHRDIKPDNVLLFGDSLEDSDVDERPVWKIGDLGLIASRDKHYDDIGEKIGPIGWLSPEAGNKFMTEKYELGLDCSIDDKSDVFQLGKLIWFIFQNNIPIGMIAREDMTRQFLFADQTFDTVVNALQHGKNRRYDMASMGADLDRLAEAYRV